MCDIGRSGPVMGGPRQRGSECLASIVGRGVAHLWRCRIRVTEGGRNREISKNEGHDVTHVTCNTAPIIYFPLWYPATVSDGRIR